MSCNLSLSLKLRIFNTLSRYCLVVERAEKRAMQHSVLHLHIVFFVLHKLDLRQITVLSSPSGHFIICLAFELQIMFGAI